MIGWALCVAHRGRHRVLDGSCVPVGREVARPYSFRFGHCAICGVELDYRRDNRTGLVETLAAGTDERHVHAPAARVELDEERMAAAIVAASRAARAERQAAAQAERDGEPPARSASVDPTAPSAAGPSASSIPTVTVWSPGPDDGSGR